MQTEPVCEARDMVEQTPPPHSQEFLGDGATRGWSDITVISPLHPIFLRSSPPVRLRLPPSPGQQPFFPYTLLLDWDCARLPAEQRGGINFKLLL